MTNTQGIFTRFSSSLKRVQSGQHEAIDMLALTILAGGHVLLEGDPGLNKTTLAKRGAETMEGDFQRVQFTPDLLPSDIVGGNRVMDGFEKFKEGPVFTNILLGDEINRAAPKTQSAMLQAMEEKCVTLDGVTRPLPKPFNVIATQNPIEHEGTYALPEAQLDRFMTRLFLYTPDNDALMGILSGGFVNKDVQDMERVSGTQIAKFQECCSLGNDTVRFEVALNDYICRIAQAVNDNDYVAINLSPRASIDIQRLAKANALANGRSEAQPTDIKKVARWALNHRMKLTFSAVSDGVNHLDLAEKIVDSVALPEPAKA